MGIERTMGFLLQSQARTDARIASYFAKADQRMRRLERVLATNNRVVTGLVRYGVSLRSDVRRLDKAMTRLAKAQAKSEQEMTKSEEKLVETEDKLNGLIDVVDKSIRRNGI
ncbi:MAG TPA: hypothetical protein VMT20_01585 [Terriglobia bacterium]|nr:hypothetical protein [Terriglobia bacterium]